MHRDDNPVRPGLARPFAAARFCPPRTLVSVIERPYLQTLVLNGLEKQVVVLSGPAGFGKTELLASVYRTCCGMPEVATGWLSLGDCHRIPTHPDDDLRAALGLGERVSKSDDLVECLAQRRNRIVLFLDGLDSGDHLPVDSAFCRLLRDPPDNVRIVLTTNGQVHLPFARLKVRGLVTEVDASQLGFTPSEIRRVLGRSVTQDELETVSLLTEGWPALIRLVAAALAADPLPLPQMLQARLLAAIGGYLEEAVLAGIDPTTCAILQSCAIVEAFNADLATALSGHDFDVEQMRPIAALVPAAGGDLGPRWYKLHPALKAYFTDKLSNRSASTGDLLNRRAAAWFAAKGVLEKAVSHAARGGDFALAAETIRQAGGVKLFIRAGHTVLDRLINDLPPDVIERSPSLSLCHALVLAKRGRIAASRGLIERLKSVDQADGAEFAAIPGSTLAHIGSLIDVYQDQHLDHIQIARIEADIEQIGPECTWERGWIYNHLCIAYTRQGDLELARLSALQALACYREEGTAYAQIFMLVHLGLVNILTGSFSAALAFARDAQDLLQSTQWCDENLRAIAQIPLAEALYQQGDLALAERLLSTSIEPMCRGEGWVEIYVRLFSIMARCRLRASGLDAAIAMIDRAEEVAFARHLPRLELATNILRIEIFAKAGMLESADHLAERLTADMRRADAADRWTWRERSDFYLARARLSLAQDRADAATSDLLALLKDAEARSSGFHQLFATILMTQSHWACGRQEAALQSLQSAIARARPHELTQPFVDAGPEFADTVRSIVRRFGLSRFSADAADFLGRMAGLCQSKLPGRFFSRSSGKTASALQPASAADALLSHREREVLALLVEGKSNKEIARSIGLAEPTVKFHLKNLFAKLGVSRRAMALAVAQKLNLH